MREIPLNPEKAEPAMNVTVFGITMRFNEEHKQNASDSILANFELD
jgi:hypothetical protein